LVNSWSAHFLHSCFSFLVIYSMSSWSCANNTWSSAKLSEYINVFWIGIPIGWHFLFQFLNARSRHIFNIKALFFIKICQMKCGPRLYSRKHVHVSTLASYLGLTHIPHENVFLFKNIAHWTTDGCSVLGWHSSEYRVMVGVCDTRDLQFTAQQPHLLHINLCQVIMYDQGLVIRYFDDVPVTFVETLDPLLSPNKITPRNLASHHTKVVNKFQVWGSRSDIAINPSVIYRSYVRYVARIVPW